jgi:predicted NACHT family NTPase
MTKLDQIVAAKLSEVIKDFLCRNKVVIILDGLDEITDLKLRDKVINSIEEFIGSYVDKKTPQSVLNSGNVYLECFSH